jgi:tRNA/tmRNA/rRNA uracil-C5-methylase (TrmA/RlmC/RlmD family)
VLPIADCPLAPAGTLGPVLGHAFEPGGEVEVTSDADDVVHIDAPGVHAGGFAADGPVVQRAAGREWRLSPGVFWQVHPALPDALADVVRDWADAPAGGLAWDLYGGVGLFAAVLAAQVGPDGGVTVVESSRQAVADGRAALADLPQVGWRVGRVERLVGGLDGRHGGGGPDVVVADPPRRGLGRELVDALCARAPGRVVHVACDPAALARDVALFGARGYRLAELRAFDAFPMTHHFECVALLVPS